MVIQLHGKSFFPPSSRKMSRSRFFHHITQNHMYITVCIDSTWFRHYFSSLGWDRHYSSNQILYTTNSYSTVVQFSRLIFSSTHDICVSIILPSMLRYLVRNSWEYLLFQTWILSIENWNSIEGLSNYWRNYVLSDTSKFPRRCHPSHSPISLGYPHQQGQKESFSRPQTRIFLYRCQILVHQILGTERLK